MARLARFVVPGLPHHVTQRGAGTRTFFGADDYALYRDLLAEACRVADVEVWAWCLLPNLVQLVLVPADADGLRRALAATHRRYAGAIHGRQQRTGPFWRGRFGAVVIDEAHLAAAVRHMALSPVRARLVKRAQDWRWSSVRVHLYDRNDGLTTRGPVRERFAPFKEFLAAAPDPAAVERLQSSQSIGRPVGGKAFLARLERRSGRTLQQGKRGPKPRRRRRAPSP